MSRIFVSYRRTDNQDATGRIYDRLTAQFGRENLFKDVDSIPLGVDFRKHLSEVVGQCQLFLAVLGTRWLDARDEAGRRRLDNPNDFVRIEIEAALARGIPVIPVLVGGSEMPAEDQLPPSLSSLAFRQGIAVRADPDFHHDMDRLSAALRAMLSAPRADAPAPSGARPDSAPGEPPARPAVADEAPAEASEPTPEELQRVQGMLARLSATAVNGEIGQLAPVARELIRSGSGREVLALCEVVKDSQVPPVERYKAIKLLGLAIRQPASRPYQGLALDTLLDYGVFSSAVAVPSLEALLMSSAPASAKWERLFGALDLASDGQLYQIVGSLFQVVPPSQRQAMGARLTELLETSTSATTPICNALQQIGYRAAVPDLIRMVEGAVPWKAVALANLLVSWQVIQAVPAIRQAIEHARYGNDAHVAQLARHLYSLEGAVASGYLTEVLRDAAPEVQGSLLSSLGAVDDGRFLDIVASLARTSTNESVRQKAQVFLKNKGAAA